MLKFILGVLLGSISAFAFVHYNLQLPAALQLPAKLRDNLISTTVEDALYTIDGDAESRQRALEIFFSRRPGDAARRDAEAGHPFLNALHRARAKREAGQLAMQWPAFEQTLAKPALRAAMERKYGTAKVGELMQFMLLDALERKPFLKAWLASQALPRTKTDLLATLRQVGAK